MAPKPKATSMRSRKPTFLENLFGKSPLFKQHFKDPPRLGIQQNAHYHCFVLRVRGHLLEEIINPNQNSRTHYSHPAIRDGGQARNHGLQPLWSLSHRFSDLAGAQKFWQNVHAEVNWEALLDPVETGWSINPDWQPPAQPLAPTWEEEVFISNEEWAIHDPIPLTEEEQLVVDEAAAEERLRRWNAKVAARKPFIAVRTLDQIYALMTVLANYAGSEARVVIDCEGFEGEHDLVRGAPDAMELYLTDIEQLYFIDIYRLRFNAFDTMGETGLSLREFLASEDYLKIMFDCRADSRLLYKFYQVKLAGIRDGSLGLMALRTAQGARWVTRIGMGRAIEQYLLEDGHICENEHDAFQDSKSAIRQSGDRQRWTRDPLADHVIEYMNDVPLMATIWKRVVVPGLRPYPEWEAQLA